MKHPLSLSSVILLSFALAACTFQSVPEENSAEKSPAAPEIKELVVFDGASPSEEMVTFSDADEVIGSASRVEAGTISDGEANALRLDYQIEHYGGVAFPIPSFDLYTYTAVAVRVALLEGTIPKTSVQFENIHGQRKETGISSYFSDLGTEWQDIEIPIDQFLFFNPGSLEEVVKVSLVMHAGQGVMGIQQIRLIKDEALPKGTWEKPAYVTPSPFPLPDGLGVWCYGSPAYIFEQVTRYNATAPESTKIRYLFPLLGSVSFQQGSYSLEWNPERGHQLHKLFNEAGIDDVFILPMIDGLTHGAHQMSANAWQSLAGEIAGVYDSDPAFYGIHLDIEPHDNVLHSLFSAIRDHTEKPISVAVAHGDTELFQYVDFAVLMTYDLAADPEGYRADAEKRIERFITDAEKVGRRAMIGVPAIATHREYESTSTTADGPRKPSGHQMDAFVKEAVESIRTHTRDGNTAYMGMSIWALHEPDGLHGPRDVLWYYPTVISEASWSLLRAPLTSQEDE